MGEAIDKVSRSTVFGGVLTNEMGSAPEAGCGGGSVLDRRANDRLRIAVHDLCQPLTALRCRLELAQMDGGSADLVAAVHDSLAQCDRLAAAVGNIRMAMQQM